MKNESHPCDNIDSQPEITERMRAILVDWLIQVQTKFELSLETLYLTINIVDWFLAVKNVPKRELQLVGISAVQMATKYEEIYPRNNIRSLISTPTLIWDLGLVLLHRTP